MATSKIINSLKVDAADTGKFLKVNASGDLELVEIQIPTEQVVTITGHDTYDLGPTSTARTYNIDEFQGTGLDTDNIVGFHVYCYTGGSNSHNVYVWYVDPDAKQWILSYSHGGNDDDDCFAGQLVYVPLQEGQTTLEFLTQQGGQYTIYAATQRVYETL